MATKRTSSTAPFAEAQPAPPPEPDTKAGWVPLMEEQRARIAAKEQECRDAGNELDRMIRAHNNCSE